MFKFTSHHDVAGYTFIMPAVSIGNVGQLAVDLLIAKIQPLKWASAWDPALIPIIGSDPYNLKDTSLTSTCELFISTEHKCVIMQLRSPLIKERRSSFLSNLVTWIKGQKFEKTVCLSSISAHVRNGPALSRIPLRYVCSDNIGESSLNSIKSLEWPLLEKRSDLPGMVLGSQQEGSNDGDFYMPQGGFTKQFYKLCLSESIPVAVLLMYCNEGCNSSDAERLAASLNNWWMMYGRCLLLGSFCLEIPHHWKFTNENMPFLQPV
ncbi:hypothetical protein B566_EDAN004355 [Ephemera danica]|nr:hypothetical protein B566_EDAN004355 [Ephemera danica]